MATILIVDDSATMRQMVAFTLTSAGHDVVQAEDANQALLSIQKTVPDLVITDLNMPGINGLDLVRALRKIASTQNKPILVLTTEADAQIKAEGRQAGATGWIVKPFDPQALLKVLPRVLS